MRTLCNKSHEFCDQCCKKILEKHNGLRCTICTTCEKCGQANCELLKFNCEHSICRECAGSQVTCPKCMISCNYCGNFVQPNPQMCGYHNSCPECKTEFKGCIFCPNIQDKFLCIKCKHYRTKHVKLPCDHLLCNKCSAESQGEYACIESPCHYCNKCSSQPTIGLCQKMLCRDCDKYLNF